MTVNFSQDEGDSNLEDTFEYCGWMLSLSRWGSWLGAFSSIKTSSQVSLVRYHDTAWRKVSTLSPMNIEVEKYPKWQETFV